MSTISAPADDVLNGATAIASYLGMSRRAVFHAVEFNHIPTYKVGARIYGRKSVLNAWRDQQEAQAFGSKAPALRQAA